MSDKPERDPNEFWWKIGSVAIAVMVWFIITTVAGLSYTNRGRDLRQPAPKPPTTNAPPLANPELNPDTKENQPEPENESSE